jgi:hypothetical protein
MPIDYCVVEAALKKSKETEKTQDGLMEVQRTEFGMKDLPIQYMDIGNYLTTTLYHELSRP